MQFRKRESVRQRTHPKCHAEVNYYACPTSKPHEVDGEECFLGMSASECPDKFNSCAELSIVSLGAGTGFENTKDLRVMKDDEAMASRMGRTEPK
jgi:hypothetical protein